MDALGPAQTESVSSLETDAGASSKCINVSDFEALPGAALAAKLDARGAAKEASQIVLNEWEDLAIDSEVIIEGLRIKIRECRVKTLSLRVVMSWSSMSVVRFRRSES